MNSDIKCLALVLCLFVQASLLSADTFIMKDGTKVEGSILREDAANYVLEVNVTKSIKDEKTISKADVVKIERLQPDAVAFAEVEKLLPTPDLLSVNAYSKRIEIGEKFLKDFGGSPNAKSARQVLAVIKKEANEVLAGGIKIDGKMIPSEEYRANAYEIDARIQEMKIRELINESHLLDSLRAFSSFERDFRNTSSFVAIAPLMKHVMDSYLDETTQLLASIDSRLKARTAGLDRMILSDRRKSEAAIQEENVECERQLKVEKDAKIGWVTRHALFKPSLEETITFGKTEVVRVTALISAPVIDGGKVYRDALILLHNNPNSGAITTTMTTVKAAMIPQRYIDRLQPAAH